MCLVGIFFNPMNVLAYRLNDIYMSTTLFYSGLLMASNMIWSHEIIHYITMRHINLIKFFSGIGLSLFIGIILLRQQLFVDKEQWLRRMIGHHSTAITTTKRLLKDNNNFKDDSTMYRLAKDIIINQEIEILQMKSLLKN
tara:strand:- start:155 stop:574 length:420 start_codon:yes stop_codon:yes gene_type:complete